MDQPELLAAPVVRSWLRTAADALAAARGELDGVNVFPVADGDTGTNMYLTTREAASAVRDAPADAGGARLLRLAARSALLGARGNSGVILSEWLRGLTVAATRGDSLGLALDVAARSARQAVAHPVPGTILTAADSAAASARHVEAGGMVGPLGAPARLSVLDAARRGAREAALRSVGTLAALRAAGVLDAGACGLVLVLGSLAAAQREVDAGHDERPDAVSEAGGSMAPVLLDMDLRGYAEPADAAPADAGTDADARPEEAAADDVELMFVLERSATAVGFRPGAVADALRADLDDVGSSVVVVGGGETADTTDTTGHEETDEGTGGSGTEPGAARPATQESLWQAHVHTADLDAALGVARRWVSRGAVSRVSVRHLAVPPERWTVVVTTGAPALAAELARAGAVVVLDLDVPPTADDLAAAALGAGTPHVLVLAPDRLLAGMPALVAAAADPGGSPPPEIVTVPAPSDAHIVSGMSALAAALDDARADDGTVDVPAAVREVVTGLRVGAGPAVAVGAIVKRLVAGSPTAIVTLLPDEAVPEATVQMLAARAEAVSGGADVVVMRTGRPGDRVGIGVEPLVEGEAPGTPEGVVP
ncbi:DAK2 domain-containing protein [Isoptericola sp. BMS4]|uniref:DAK2 domain-containing protein n=1 Tax=Isoptericola sp. BMS4 TaxID=2527875 RepID=UPI001F0E3E3B|nr:DAK2 domain-containing protein [Isoptericola sp. BMS4]